MKEFVRKPTIFITVKSNKFEETDCLNSIKCIKNNSYEFSELILIESTKTMIFLNTQLNFTLHLNT